MSEVFKLYKEVASSYKGSATSATELALEAKQQVGKRWVRVKPFTQCVAGNVRRTRIVDGVEITEEFKEAGNYDDTIAAKLMLIFKTYINNKIYQHRRSFSKEDILYQADLALRYALELYQPQRMVTRKRKNKLTGEMEEYEVLTDVKFEQAWRVIFESNIQGMYQDHNRNNRKILHETSSLDRLQEDYKYEPEDDSFNPYKDYDIDELLTYFKETHNLMAYIIVTDHKYPIIKDGNKTVLLTSNQQVNANCKVKDVTKDFIFKQYKEAVKGHLTRKYGHEQDGETLIAKKLRKLTKFSLLNELYTKAMNDIKEELTYRSDYTTHRDGKSKLMTSVKNNCIYNIDEVDTVSINS